MILWPETQPTLIAGDLTLRPWQESDADRIYEICQDPTIQEFTTIPVPYTQAHAIGFVATRTEAFSRSESMPFAGVVDGRVVLSISLHNIALFDHIGELGYWLAPEARGSGLTSRAVTTLTDYLFTIGFRRLTAQTLPENHGSQKTLTNAGFHLESVVPQGMTRRDESQTDAMLFVKFPPVDPMSEPAS